MWDDEPAPWGDDDTATGEATGGTEEAPAADAAPAERFDWKKANLPKADPPEYTLHWVKPLYLNYRYLYDYRFVLIFFFSFCFHHIKCRSTYFYRPCW